jgi:DNA segregation ATPase FtsK/SpoIIIE-like protein
VISILNDVFTTTGIVLVIYSTKGIYNIVKTKIEELIKIRKMNIPLSDKQLLLGYEIGNYKPIVIDMAITPHLFVCGLSQCGKSRMIEFAIKDKNVILLNVFEEDFKSIKSERINGNDNIKEYLKKLVAEPCYRSSPIYIVIDELLVLCMNKDVTQAIMDLLAIGRHYNIFVIGISQTGTKETVKFKDLFNARICFRQVEESAYRTVLGYSPEIKDLKPRQFHLYSDKLAFGCTYDIRPGS